MAKPFEIGPKAAAVLAQLCTHDNSLPQGSPVSPILSNFIAADLDNRLTALARHYKLYYTRYADDITFSTTQGKFPSRIAYFEGSNPVTGNTLIGKELERAISSSGFKINSGKVRLQIPNVRQEVTGLTVNEFPNVERKYVRKIRAMVHAWKKHGLIEAEREHLLKYTKSPPDIDPDELDGTCYKKVLYGHLAYLKMVRGENDKIYMKLCLEMEKLDPDLPEKMQQLIASYEEYDVFICHASEDKDCVAEPIFKACEDAGIKAFLDDKYIKWGDSITQKINHALGRSKFVLAILSENSVNKVWPAREINAALARELKGKQKILPLVVGDVDLSPLSLLEDKKHLKWENNADEIAKRIEKEL